MSDARKTQLKIAKARAAYREHLRELQAAGLVLSVDDPHNLTAFSLAGEASLVGAVWAGDRTSAVVVVGDDGETRLDAARSGSAPVAPAVHPQLGAAVPIYQLTAVEVEFEERDEDDVQELRLVFRLPSAPATNVELRADCILPKGATRATLMTFQTPLASSELVAHLNENALHYSQQVWLSLDPGSLTVLLARYSYEGNRLIEQIDPTPLSAAGNCLVFRWKAEDAQAWKDWTASNVDTSSVAVDLVAMPTGGVFAEAVLGRFNSAEKLDLTRFWNWQDSPIPIQAPEIAALQAGQRVVAESTTPGDLDAPVVTIQNPQPLPDPTGLSGALAALTAANLFRDMSNGSATAALAQAALQASAQGAQGIAAQAGANMATAGQFTLEMTKALAAAALGIPAAPGPGLTNVSTAGAAINHGAKMDAAAQAPNPLPLDGTDGGPVDGTGSSGGGAGTGGTSSGAGGRVITASTRPSQEQLAFASTLAGAGAVSGNAPTSTPVGAAGAVAPKSAVQIIDDFKNRSGPGKFDLDRSKVANRLTKLTTADPFGNGCHTTNVVSDTGPRMLDQRGLNVCGVAAFLHVWLKRDPAAVAQFAVELYETGRSRIGGLDVVPHPELLNQSHRAIWPTTSGSGESQFAADFMMLSALRDAANAFPFLGHDDEELGGITPPGDVVSWLTATGLYREVRNRTSIVGQRPIEELEELQPNDSRDVVVLLHTLAMAGPGVPGAWQANQPSFIARTLGIGIPNHYVVLNCPVERVGDQLRLRIWCWGRGDRPPLEMPVTALAEHFYGAIVAR
ncbi:hypothetical protein [Pseudonocardia sp.]|uniref:hypothetical protein n=1 Tax=Pseudonocardia sp. TaxID=60912 RepID=UPI003D1013A0